MQADPTVTCRVVDSFLHSVLRIQAAWASHQNELFRAEHDQDGGGNHPRSIASIRRANTADSTNMSQESDFEIDPTSIGKLCPPESNSSNAHIICNWRAILGDEVIHGEHHMRAISIRPKTYFKGCPVYASATYPSALSHDFSKGPAVSPIESETKPSCYLAPDLLISSSLVLCTCRLYRFVSTCAIECSNRQSISLYPSSRIPALN